MHDFRCVWIVYCSLQIKVDIINYICYGCNLCIHVSLNMPHHSGLYGLLLVVSKTVSVHSTCYIH